ncbi:putative desaturase [Pseudomonas sp. GM41(2012)]|nr:putative desaturase [Pseudomonas sp. GM41(2012)]
MSEPSLAFAHVIQPLSSDYRLSGPEVARAAEKSLVSAHWYQSALLRKRLKELMQRRDGPGLRDTAI